VFAHFVVLVLLVRRSSKKAQGSVVSNQLGVKFGRTVLHVNKYASFDGVRFPM